MICPTNQKSSSYGFWSSRQHAGSWNKCVVSENESWRMIYEPYTYVCFCTPFYVQCQWFSHKSGCFFRSLTRRNSPNGSSFFPDVCQRKFLNISFPFSIVQKTPEQSDGSCNDIIECQFCCKLFEKLRFSLQKQFKSTMYVKTCNAQSNDKVRFLVNCRYHITLFEEIQPLLPLLGFFGGQHVDSF